MVFLLEPMEIFEDRFYKFYLINRYYYFIKFFIILIKEVENVSLEMLGPGRFVL